MESPSKSAAKQHIEAIRKEFCIGEGKGRVSKSLRMAVKYLSDELYSKDVHFLMELIQNAEDNEYPEGVEPSLEFMITSRDITATGAPATLLIFNNERGFSCRNIDSICSVGDSTKAGNRKRGYIGEKGIGFKSVFLLTAQPHIISNGYQIRFSEAPCPVCDIAYIVPEWVDNVSWVSCIQQVYGHSNTLPTTTLILPLKPDKVKAVKEQLSNLHPELLLFLSKIKRLSVKEDNEDPRLNTIRAVSISSERDFLAKKDIDAESYTVHLTAEGDEDDSEGECGYYMWRQRFPVGEQNKVEKRKDIDEWAITLAFPFGKRLNRGMSSPGIYAFLPTETVTNLPFVIQSDFLLPSSRETILWDDRWNQGILDCVPSAFINAFVSLVKTREDAPPSSLASMFAFLPVNSTNHSKLNVIRESIKVKLLQENILLSESQSKQKFFHKPSEVGRLMPAFWSILEKVKGQGVKLHNLSSPGKHILHSSFDKDKYNDVLNFLKVGFVDSEWYLKCIKSCNLVLGVGEDVYLELLQFLAENWNLHFDRAIARSIPLLKYVDGSGTISLLSINEAKNQSNYPSLCQSQCTQHTSWLIDWSKEFISASKLAFLPVKMQEYSLQMHVVYTWLRDHVNVRTLNVYEYASLLQTSLGSNRRSVLAFAHFIYHSFVKRFLSMAEVQNVCSQMPLIDRDGNVCVRWKGLLVPANGSKWVELMGSNPWRGEDFMELAEDYMHSGKYAGRSTPEIELVRFLQKCAGASDIPDIYPPNADFPTVAGPLTKQNVFFLLDWIRNLKSRGNQIPSRFLSCIENGSWLKVTMSGCPGYKPPSRSFLPSSSWGNLLKNGSDIVDIPLVDQLYYDNKIGQYGEELKAIGVRSEYGQACEFIGKHLMSMAAKNNLTGTKVLAMLNFIRFLRDKYLHVDEFINSINKVKWVRTSCGGRLPGETILYDESWEAASVISQIPFLDIDYYGKDILEYKDELKLLGVVVAFGENYQIVIDHLKPATSMNSLTPKSLLFALKCVCKSRPSKELASALKSARCLRTNIGYLPPVQCFLFDKKWGCILQVFEGFPYVEVEFYGSGISQYKNALREIGVVVDFEVAIEKFSTKFREQASSKSFTKENALSFIKCYKKLEDVHLTFPADLRACIQEVRWLRTRLGDCRTPKDCILFSPGWQPISEITLLPFVDDSVSCYGKGIYEYRSQLKSMGVVVDLCAGSHFVLSHICFPDDPTLVSSGSLISLLECIREFKLKGQEFFPETFLTKIHQAKCLKTTFGYMSPQECLLFDCTQRPLQQCDGPFIDEEFYGPLSSYKSELAAIGVIIDVRSSDAKAFLLRHIESLAEFSKIERIYEFLIETDWKPDDLANTRIWVPTSTVDGKWVSPVECVLHDDKSLFRSRLHVLDQTDYKPKLLKFFSKAFKVRGGPSTSDYCSLWKEWENTRHVLSLDECCAFWGHVTMHWSMKTEKLISENVAKIPAFSGGSSDILLVSKRDLFIPDDLLLKDLFEKSSPSLFVWRPMKKLLSISRHMLLDIYSKIGVRKISESVSKCDLSDLKCVELKQVTLRDVSIVKGLGMLILGFLADPKLNMGVESRHETLQRLLNVTAFETTKPIIMSYSLKLSTGDSMKVSTSQMVRWERDSSEFFVQRVNRSDGHKKMVEYATKFSDVVSEGLLWEKEDQAPQLSELIKFGFFFEFNEDAVAYFMKSRNIEIFAEDEEFLSSVFPSL